MLTIETLRDHLTGLKNCEKFFEAWLSWRTDDVLPLRNNVRPEIMGQAMEGIAILEVKGPENIIFRMQSSLLVETTGVDQTGQNVIDLSLPGERARRINRYARLIEFPCGLFTKQEVKMRKGANFDLYALFLPVLKDELEPPRFIYVGQDIPTSLNWTPEERDAIDYRLASDFSYIDLGSGAPED